MKKIALRRLLGVSLLLSCFYPALVWSEAQSAYQTPPKAMADLVDAPRQPMAIVSEDSRFILFASVPGVQSLAEVAKPEVKLAGIRIDPTLFASSRGWAIDGLSIKDLQTGALRKIEVPSKRLYRPVWSPDSTKIAFIAQLEHGLFPYVYDLKKQSLQKYDVQLNTVLAGDLIWTRDSQALIATAVSGLKKPEGAAIAAAPAIQISSGQKSAVRTYQDLLKNKSDEALFAYYTSTQLTLIPLSGAAKSLGKPAIHASVQLSPDGSLLLVNRLTPPFSYVVPYYAFATQVDVIDLQGKVLKTVAKIPLQDKLPQGFDAVITGPRDHSWRHDAPATLVYAEAQDGGDMAKNVAVHDRVFAWAAPFKQAPQAVLDLEMRYSGIWWGNADHAMVLESRFKDRMLKISRFSPNNPAKKPSIFNLRSYNDAYADPGSPQFKPGPFGAEVMDIQGDAIFLSGLGASAKGNVPFLDKYSLTSGEKQRLWQSEDQWYDRFVTAVDASYEKILILREAPTIQPNFHLKDLKNGTMKAMSDFPHPTPYFANVKKELVKYKRKDGVELSGNLYLPPDYQPSSGPLPVLMWAYPLEFKDASTAGQVNESPYQFNRISAQGPLAHLAQGFAVFDDPKMPIIGEGEKLPNDSFRQQLIDGAEAAIAVLVERGIADPKRIAVGGHSYGAFMTANLLAHSDLFAAGIARSGAYNRSLTPFGFQGEERHYWQATTVYQDMSPFNYADQINEPLLMIHGEEDNNSGTFPMQSQRMYGAMAGLGGQAKLVMLPYEQHGYRARESILHMLWEQHQWLENHVKNRR